MCDLSHPVRCKKLIGITVAQLVEQSYTNTRVGCSVPGSSSPHASIVGQDTEAL